MVAVEDGGAQTDEGDGADSGHRCGASLLREVTGDKASGGAEGELLEHFCRCERHDASLTPFWHLVKMGGEMHCSCSYNFMLMRKSTWSTRRIKHEIFVAFSGTCI